MRLGEIENLVRPVVDEAGRIVIQHEVLFGGQAYLINNFVELSRALNVLKDQKWNSFDFSAVETVLTKYSKVDNPAQITQDEFNALNNYINSANDKLPVFLSITESLDIPQEEQYINVKLPDGIKSLTELKNANNKLDKLFKEFTIEGEINFEGFDRGSDWIILGLTGVYTYQVFIGCLKIAKEYFNTSEAYYKSKKAMLDYKAMIKVTKTDFDEAQFKKYQEERLNLQVEDGVDEVLKNVKDLNGHEQSELQVKLVKATTELAKELGDGVEFHLSLKPPSYASETNGGLSIDYGMIREINDAKQSQPQLPDSTEPTESQKSDQPA